MCVVILRGLGIKFIKKTGIACFTTRSICSNMQQRGSVENQLFSGRPPKLRTREVRKLKRIIMSDRKLTLTQVTAAYNQQI